MATTNQPVRACVLKVDVKCCSGCQNKACTKLLNLPGVSTAEYNAVKGLMTVTGDVDPMTLVQKLTRCKKKTELVSVNYMPDDTLITTDEEDDEEDEDDEDDTSSSSDDTSSNPDPRPMKRETQVSMKPTMNKKKEGMVRKYLTLGCLRSKPKVVQPMATRMFGSTRFGNGAAFPRRPPPPPPQFHGPMNPQQQYHHMMMQPRQQPQPQPQFQMNGVPPPMQMIQQLVPLQKPPYFIQQEPQYKAAAEAAKSMFPQQPKPDPKMLVNHAIHYSGK